MNGFLVIDKPHGITSHDVVHQVRRIADERSVGHLGTLDPMATGVLPLMLGKYTRLAQYFADACKTYEGTIRFGVATDTYDADGDLVGDERPASFSESELKAVLEGFVGETEQVPPPFSAKKVKGVPAYKLARKDKEVVLGPVKVRIDSLELLAWESPEARIRVTVSSGTYIRSIAHEAGRKLVCGAHLSSLRRTASGEFNLTHT